MSKMRYNPFTGEMDYIESVQYPYLEETSSYGVEFSTSVSSPKCTRIGNLSLHIKLPIHSRMKGCLLNDNGDVVEYLDPNDWSNNVLDGSRGQVMVEIPLHYRKFETDGSTRRVMISEHPLPGYHEVPKVYVSAYEATVHRPTNTLASVVNSSPDYRGGANNSSWDLSAASLLGKPVTGLSRTSFRAFARNRKPTTCEWNCMTYDVQKTLYWLYVIEYATLNSQTAFDPKVSTEGYRNGGLGPGLTQLSDSLWSAFNNYNPVLKCGLTNIYGNRSGEIIYGMPLEYNPEQKDPVQVNVNRYRGIEAPFGHISKWVDGINVRVMPAADGVSMAFACQDPSRFSDTGYNGYAHIGNLPRSSGYISSVLFGNYGEILPSAISSGSTTYHCDYFYMSVPEVETLRGVLFGGFANLGALAGFVSAYALLVPSYSDACIGSRLCFIPINE